MSTKFGYELSGKGEKGDRGPEGPQGPPGIQGKGISNITYDDPNDQLVITYDDATSSNIPFPGISLDTTANIRAYGANNANKFLVEDNAGNDIFIVNTSTPIVSSNTNFQVTGSDNANKFVVKNNANSNILNVNTINGITSLSNSNSTQLSMTTSGSISGIGFNTSGFSKNIQMNSGVFSVDGAFSPNANITYDLGGTSSRWNNIYGGLIDVISGITSSSASNGTQPIRLTLTNSGTGANTGVQMSFNGHNGTSATNSTINFNGSNLTFTIPSGGNYIFNASTRPSTAGTLSLGTSGNRWSTVFCTAIDCSGSAITTALTASAANAATVSNRLTLTNSGTGAGTGTQITFNGHNGTSATAGNIQHNGTHFLYNATTGGDHAFNSNVRPQTDNTVTCGSSLQKWTAVWATNGTIQTSDQRAKNTITDEDLGLDFINQLRPVKYKFNVQRNEIVYTNVPRVDENGNPVYEQIELLDENGNPVYDENDNRVYVNGNQIIDVIQSIVPIPGTKFYHGLIAQEIDTVLTNNNLTTNDFAGLNKDDPNSFGVAYTEFLAPMIKAIQELKIIVDQQQSTINDLQTQINQILNQ